MSEQPMPRDERAWHALKPEAALDAVASAPTGLASEEAGRRLREVGPNSLTPPPRRGPFLRLVSQFNNVLIYVLLGASVVTALLGHYVDTGVIVGVVLVNALIGFIQEGKAEHALEAVRGLLAPQATVIRDGRRVAVDAAAIVPGDLVFVQSGDRVPADLRLLQVRRLQLDEAVLTGESVPVTKGLDPVPVDASLGDRLCMAYSGTLVTYGQGTGVVVATGDATEIGRISGLIARVQTLSTPLMRQLAAFGRWLTGAILFIATFTALFGILARDYVPGEMFLAAVGLAVAAIPEGLPAIITITLAIGVQRMAARNAIIRRLPAVETLGSVSVICSDKTGTLTRNEMTVQSLATSSGLFEVSGVGYDPHGEITLDGAPASVDEYPLLEETARAAMLCNDAGLREEQGQWRIQGDPTEGALVTLAVKAGLDAAFQHEEWPRTDVIPFESEHRFMATLHHDHAGHAFVYLKGAPERVLDMCVCERMRGEDQPLNRLYWEACMERMARRGQRLLAIAFKTAQADQRSLRFSDVENGLTLLAIVGIIDPPREEAIAAVRRCAAAGIRVKMITGDHIATARAIATQMGIGQTDRAMTGAEIEGSHGAGLAHRAGDTDVFARASPEHKLRLVEALQSQGAVVAMTGDGVNDAPALKRADVGVAMGIKGTEAAQEAAEMVLADDNFASIAYAVEEGRTVYDNIRKAILFILPTNGGEALTILAAIALGRMLPVTAAQILWVNMITAVTLALALAFDPPESDVMRRAPRDTHEPMLTGFMVWRILFVSLLMVSGTFGLFLWERTQGTDIDTARTIAVNTLVLVEVFYLINTRFLLASSVTPRALTGNGYIIAAILAVLLFQLIFTYVPFMQLFFHTKGIDGGAWLRILAVGLILFGAVEIEKAVLSAGRGRLTRVKGRH
jgi:magnesium-transporting ATPase (P-type)